MKKGDFVTLQNNHLYAGVEWLGQIRGFTPCGLISVRWEKPKIHQSAFKEVNLKRIKVKPK